MTCWGVVYQDGFLYIPIFDEDRHLIHERAVESYIKDEIPIGTVFTCENEKQNGKRFYQSAADERGFYLKYSHSPFLFNREQNTVPYGRTAMIVKMTFDKEGSGV